MDQIIWNSWTTNTVKSNWILFQCNDSSWKLLYIDKTNSIRLSRNSKIRSDNTLITNKNKVFESIHTIKKSVILSNSIIWKSDCLNVPFLGVARQGTALLDDEEEVFLQDHPLNPILWREVVKRYLFGNIFLQIF